MGYFIHKREIDDIQQQGDVFKKAQSNFSIDPETFTSVETLLTAEHVTSSTFLLFTDLSSVFEGYFFPQIKTSSTHAATNVIV
ncbi:hypothetical protein OROHE_004552 [Orobanche hederae]